MARARRICGSSSTTRTRVIVDSGVLDVASTPAPSPAAPGRRLRSAGGQRHHHGEAAAGGLLRGRACRPWPRSARGTGPARARHRWCCRCRRAAGTGRRPGRSSVGGMPGPAVDDPQLDAVAEAAAGDQRRARPAGCTAGRCRPGWRGPAPAGRGRRARAGRSSGTSTTTGRPAGAEVVQGQRHHLVERERAVDRPTARRPAAGSCRAGCPPGGRAGPGTRPRSSSSSSWSSGDHSMSSLRRLVTAALADASGVRRSWPTAASSAVRIRSPSASGTAAAAASAEPVPLQDHRGLRGERPDRRRWSSARSGRPAQREHQACRRPAPRCRRPGALHGRAGAGHDRPASAGRARRRPAGRRRRVRSSSVTRGQPEGLADPLEQRGQRRLAAAARCRPGAQGLGLRGRAGGLPGAPGGQVDRRS